uniref:Protein kinase domain-containing protein n=1 Tax=Globodera rostochiensis TaxID=31243 RepID=A0A914I6H0_GLORO
MSAEETAKLKRNSRRTAPTSCSVSRTPKKAPPSVVLAMEEDVGEEGGCPPATTISSRATGAVAERLVRRRGSNSVGRRHVQPPQQPAQHEFENGKISGGTKEGVGVALKLKLMDSEAERHRNEKILSCPELVTRIGDRSVFYKMFELGSQIGQGNFSDVFLVFNAEKGEKYAVKEIDKGRMNGKLHFVENEIALLQRCPHRNICRLVDAFECRRMYFLLFDYAQKGDLFETIRRVGRLSERSCAQITRQIASALAFLHRRRIVHRDVKPENILLTADSTAKLTDFGLACILVGPLYRVCGTPTYVAPEILTQQGYGVEVDVWSLGIILHICLVGFAPFHCTDRAQLFQQIVHGKITFEHANWSLIATKAKKLLLGMLTAAPKRMDAEQVTRNEWIVAMTTQNADEPAGGGQ